MMKSSGQSLKITSVFSNIIINSGDDATKRGLFDLDKCCLSEDAYDNCHKRGNSTTYTAIYAAVCLLHQQGSEQYGKSGLFEAFLKDDSQRTQTVLILLMKM